MYGIIIEPELYETQINMLIYANTFKYTMYFRFVRYQYFGNCDSYLTLIRLEYIYVGLDIFSNAVNIMLFQMSLLKYLASPNRILVKSIFLKPTAYIFLKHRMHLIKMQMLWFYDWPTNSKKQRTFIKAIYGLYIYVYICIYTYIYISRHAWLNDCCASRHIRVRYIFILFIGDNILLFIIALLCIVSMLIMPMLWHL